MSGEGGVGAGSGGHEPDDDIGDGGGLGKRDGSGQTSVDTGGRLAVGVGLTEDVEGVENVERVKRTFQSSFENVNSFLQSYLTIVSQDPNEGDLVREIITEGSQLLDLLQTAYSGLSDVIPSRSLEAPIRNFIQNCLPIEDSRKSPETAFSDLEIFSMVLIKELKKHGVETEVDRDATNSNQINEKKTVHVKFVDPFKNVAKKSYQCPYCDHKTEGTTVKSLQFHIRKKHSGSPQVKESTFAADGEQKNEIICMLKKKNGTSCSKKFSPDQIVRHLLNKKSHQQAHVQPEGQEFKGWRIRKVEEVEEVEIVWGLASASNPPSDEEIELEIQTEKPKEILPTSKKRKIQKNQEDSDSKKQKAEKTAPSASHSKSKELEKNSYAALSKENQNGTENDEVSPNIFQEKSNQVLIIPGSFQETPASVENPDDFLQDGNLIGLSFEMDTNSNPVILDEEIVPDVDSVSSPAALDNFHTSPQTPEDDEVLLSPSESNLVRKGPTDLLLSSAAVTIENDDLMNKQENVVVQEGNVDVVEQSQEDQVQLMMNSSTLNEMESQEALIMFSNAEQTETLAVKENVDGLNEVLSSQSQESILEDLEPVPTPSPVIDFITHEDLSRRVHVKVHNPIMKKGQRIWSDENFSTQIKETVGAEDMEEKLEEINQSNLPDLEVEEDSEDDSDEDDMELDSDYDEDLDSDRVLFRKRQEARKVRFRNRDCDEKFEDLSEKPGNEPFIDEFMSWLETKTSLKTSNKKCSTLNLSRGHLYQYADSFLYYSTSLDSSFNLGKLVDFQNKDNFLSIKSPVAWISTAAGTDKTSNPSRQKEQLKLHKRVRSFVLYKLNSTAFDGNDVILTLVVNNQLQAIDKEIAENKLFQKLTVLYEKEKAKTKKMKLIANPNCDELQYDCVKRWFKSKEAKELEEMVHVTCQKASKEQKIKAMAFNKVANYVRFNLAIRDKNRPSTYKFTEGDYISKIPIWLPEGDKYLWSMETLPSDWRMFTAPEDGAAPTCFLIRLDGSQSEIKMQAKTDVIVDMKSFEILELFRDLKRMVFGGNILSSSPFFVNHKGKPLSRIQRSKGSLVEKFGKVVGIPEFRMTNIRAALEGKIQGGKEADHTKDINNHSKSVAVDSYDNAASMRRSLYISSVAADESSEVVDMDKVKNHYNLRKKKGQEELQQIQSDAEDYLQKKKQKKKVVNLVPNQLSTSDLAFLRILFTADDYEGDEWKKRFYWNCDCLSSEDGNRLRRLEEAVFRSQKASIVKEMKKKKWNGSDEMNKLADLTVSSVFKKALLEVEN